MKEEDPIRRDDGGEHLGACRVRWFHTILPFFGEEKLDMWHVLLCDRSGGEIALRQEWWGSVLNSCRAGPCRLRARRAFVSYRTVSLLFYFFSCRAVSCSNMIEGGTVRIRHAVSDVSCLNRVVPIKF
jgi:hypothetical protein